MSKISIMNDVIGIDGRTNTILHHSPSSSTINQSNCSSKGHLVFFPGDIQDFAETMKQHHSCKDYVQWSYETTASILSSKFPLCHVWLIVPSTKTHKTIAIYKNFVESESLLGIPSHSAAFNGLQHLKLLLENLILQFDFADKIILIGFSKGCIVLNQFLYELSHLVLPHIDNHARSANQQFIKQISTMVWLDGGHSGEKDVWVTSPSIISSLSNDMCRHIFFSIHVTPYQIKDEHRPWKGKSKSTFVNLLRQNNLKFNDCVYFEDEVVTIDMHFNLLLKFKDVSF